MPSLRSNGGNIATEIDTAGSEENPLIVSEKQFRRILCQERKRSERSRKSFLLMLVRVTDLKPDLKLQNGQLHLPKYIPGVLSKLIRDTDLIGWFESHSALGTIFNELGTADTNTAINVIKGKIEAALKLALPENLLGNLELDFYVFPDNRRSDSYKLPIDPELYPDVFDVEERTRFLLLIKRSIDILGSSFALLLLSPTFLVLAIIIKATSKGPVFFRQERVGQFEVPFTFIKFRSMRASTDPQIHREYVRKFIAGSAEPHASTGSRKVYKITDDPRVTWIGKFMRRASLDELPQFWNVLKGEMSLVGPRPPIRYELEVYDLWHRRRLLEVKPGITGLWQIKGRSRTTFDEMVRLDLRYANTWSPLSDLKILLQTPRAVFSGDGAY